jgi:hypothetical protein
MNLISKPNEIPGSQTGSQRRQIQSDVERHLAAIWLANWHFRRYQATYRDGSFAPFKRGATGSNPVAPTRQGNLVTDLPVRRCR